jgi:hypothetical protein
MSYPLELSAWPPFETVFNVASVTLTRTVKSDCVLGTRVWFTVICRWHAFPDGLAVGVGVGEAVGVGVTVAVGVAVGVRVAVAVAVGVAVAVAVAVGVGVGVAVAVAVGVGVLVGVTLGVDDGVGVGAIPSVAVKLVNPKSVLSAGGLDWK